MGDLPVSHHRLGQNAVHVQAAAHGCEDVLQKHTNVYHDNDRIRYAGSSPSFLPHLPVGGQMLDGHLAGFGSGQPDFGLSAGLRLLPQDVLVGEDVPIHGVPEDQLARVGTAGEEPV